MKNNLTSSSLLLLLLLLLGLLIISISSTAVPFSSTKQGGDEAQSTFNDIQDRDFHEKEAQSTNFINDLMGLEICENEDEECLKRRVLAEAHLDYIYTQQHNP